MASSRIDGKKICFPYVGREETYYFTISANSKSYGRVTQEALGAQLDGYTSVIAGFNSNHTGLEIVQLNAGTNAATVCNNTSSNLSNRTAILNLRYISNDLIAT